MLLPNEYSLSVVGLTLVSNVSKSIGVNPAPPPTVATNTSKFSFTLVNASCTSLHHSGGAPGVILLLNELAVIVVLPNV